MYQKSLAGGDSDIWFWGCGFHQLMGMPGFVSTNGGGLYGDIWFQDSNARLIGWLGF